MPEIGKALASIVWRPWNRWSGLGKLAESYPAPADPPEPLFLRQTVQVNSIRWRKTAMLGPSDQGLYLQIGTAPAALVPWDDIQDQGASVLFMLPAHTLALGEPSLVDLRVYIKLYEQIVPYLQA